MKRERGEMEARANKAKQNKQKTAENSIKEAFALLSCGLFKSRRENFVFLDVYLVLISAPIRVLKLKTVFEHHEPKTKPH